MESASKEEIYLRIEQELPSEIDGYVRRVGCFANSSTIIYSKNGGYLFKGVESKNSRTIDLNDFKSNLLYVVSCLNLEDCLVKMKQKIELNSRVKYDFLNYIILGFSTSHKSISENVENYSKLFEIRLVLDTDSESQFFTVVTINPLFDLQYIIPELNVIKEQIKSKTLLIIPNDDLTYSELNYYDFDLPKAVHLYSEDFLGKKDEIRTFLKKHNWNVKFRDRYYFDKQKPLKNLRIILCEGNNITFLNNLHIPNVLFSKEHNCVTIFQNIKTHDKFALRDKDYLLLEEIKRLKNIYKKYYILDYYCIENYLYHPDNIEELKLEGYDKELYIKDIINSKEENLDKLISSIPSIRLKYKELSENHIKPVKNANELLIEELKSNEFEIFYSHFDMKSIYKKTFLQKYNLNAKKLSTTKWFKLKLSKLIE